MAKYKADAETLPEVQRQLEKAQNDLEAGKKDSWKVKYEAIKEEFEDYKSEQAKKETRAAKEKAYRELDARFCRMTGKKPDADELFGKPAVRQSVPAQKEAPENGARENRMCRRKGRRPGF